MGGQKNLPTVGQERGGSLDICNHAGPAHVSASTEGVWEPAQPLWPDVLSPQSVPFEFVGVYVTCRGLQGEGNEGNLVYKPNKFLGNVKPSPG